MELIAGAPELAIEKNAHHMRIKLILREHVAELNKIREENANHLRAIEDLRLEQQCQQYVLLIPPLATDLFELGGQLIGSQWSITP